MLGLGEMVGMTVVDPLMSMEGWHFSERDGCSPNSVTSDRLLRQLYQRSAGELTCRVTVPVLWDRTHERIVNNESTEIVRMFDRVLAPALGKASVFTAPELDTEVQAWHDILYPTFFDGVYRCGFTRSQSDYDVAVSSLFDTLDLLEQRLSQQPWILDHGFSELDLYLFATCIRFDSVYHHAFQVNRRPLSSYPSVHNHMVRVMALDGIAETVRLDHIVEHYLRSDTPLAKPSVLPAMVDDPFLSQAWADLTLPVSGDPAVPWPREAGRALSAAEIQAAVQQRPRLTEEDGWLVYRESVDSWTEGSRRVREIQAISDAFNHHPDITQHYRSIVVRVRTHDLDALTTLDLALLDGIQPPSPP